MRAKYRVLSADDEFWSRENIRRMLRWEDYSIDFLEPACDGEEVLERIPEERPDIVITDINMPFLSGLDLLNRIHNEYPEIITIAVSGYDDFQKVKGVFVSGGIDYLLKPVGREQLVDTLSKAIKILEKREEDRAAKEDSRLKESYISSFLEDDEFSSLLSGKLYRPGKESHIPSTGVFSEISTMLIKFHDVEILKQSYQKDMLKMSYSLKSKIRELIGEEHTIVFNYKDKVNEFIVELNATPARLRFIADKILGAFPVEEQGPITVVIHDQSSSLDDIASVYREMIAELVTRPFGREHYIVSCSNEKKKTGIQERYTDRIEALLLECLCDKNTEQAQNVIMDIAGLQNCESAKWSLFEVTQFTTGVMNTIADTDRRNDSRAYEEVMDAVNYGLRTLNKEMIFDNIRVALIVAAGPKPIEDNSIRDQVENVRAFIEKHYMDHLSLSELAAQFYVEPSYLSKKFSKEYNETITAYITRCRMDQAKELMMDENNKLEVISFKVGYDDYNYFSRVFRRIEGVSPSEYRKRQKSDSGFF